MNILVQGYIYMLSLNDDKYSHYWLAVAKVIRRYTRRHVDIWGGGVNYRQINVNGRRSCYVLDMCVRFPHDVYMK